MVKVEWDFEWIVITGVYIVTEIFMNVIQKIQSRQKCVSPSRYHDKYYDLDVSYIFAFCVLLDLYIFPLRKWR